MVTSTRNPFETMMVAAFGLYCVASLAFFDEIATTVLRAFPPPWALVFLSIGTAASSITMTGIIRARTVKGVLYERSGLTMLAGVTFAYAIWGFGNIGIRATAFGVLLLAVSGASAWRSWQISRARKAALR